MPYKLGLPAANRSLFSNATSAANAGVLQDVPETGTGTLYCDKTKFSASNATSGYAAAFPDELKSVPDGNFTAVPFARYCATGIA